MTDQSPRTNLSLRTLRPSDLDLLLEFFHCVASSGVGSFFHPHAFDAHMAQVICNYDGADWYAGAFLRSLDNWIMAGYVMLRGWDEGYEEPSFGVCVLSEFQGYGIGSLLLKYAITTAILRGSPAIRLKVYPENKHAVDLYQSFGFQYAQELQAGQLVGRLHLPLRSHSYRPADFKGDT